MTKLQVMNSQKSLVYAANLSQAMICHYNAPFVSAKTASKKLACSSFSSSLHAAMGSELGGTRSFLLSSPVENDVSQAAYMRLPIVIGNVSMPTGTFSIKPDHSDIASVRDSGSLIFLPENNTEVIESVIQAYKVCEDPKVLLPAIVNVDLPNFSESVLPPSDIYAKRFLSTLRLPFGFGKKLSYFNVPEDHYDYKKQQQKAMNNAIPAIEAVSELWKKNFKRQLPLIEKYKIEDAETILVMSGFHSTTAKAAIDKLRSQGKRVGLVRIRVFRPFPKNALQNALKNAKNVIVFDQSVSIGAFGVFYTEVMPFAQKCFSFISLGSHPSEKTFASMFSHIERPQKVDVFWP